MKSSLAKMGCYKTLSLCTAAPPLKKIDFFDGRGGCTQAIRLFIYGKFKSFQNVRKNDFFVRLKTIIMILVATKNITYSTRKSYKCID